MMMKGVLIPGSLMAVLLGLGAINVSPSAMAQMPPSNTQPAPAEVTDEQLDQFVRAYQSIQAIQQETQAEVVSAIEAEGLTIDEFNAIAQTMQSSDGGDLPPQQAEPFMAAAEQVSAIQADVRAEMESAIESENLTVGEFEEILMMAQQDPALQEQINQRLQP